MRTQSVMVTVLVLIRVRWINDPTSLKRNRIVDPCLFARAAAPKAAFHELVIVSKWVAWVSFRRLILTELVLDKNIDDVADLLLG